ncbi:MAG: MFS transporter [Chlorobia bacterium]|nr:MFS transporter [Fimbriimonadaceae bacterium]
MPISDRLPALGHRDFRNFILGSFVSNVGGSVQMWAVAWHVYDLTKNPFMSGLVAGIRVVPLLLFSLIGGVFADRYNRRTILMITQSFLAIFATLIAVTTYTGNATAWSLIALVTLSVIPMAFNNPARQAMMPSLVPKEDFPNAASVNGVQWRLSEVLGPAIAGILIGLPMGPVKGLTICYLFNALSFLALIYAVWLLPNRVEADKPDKLTVPMMIELIREGLVFVWRKPILRQTMTLDFWATLLSGAEALLPAFADILKLGPEGYGLLASSIGVGAMLAAGVMALLPPIVKQGQWVLAMVACYGLVTIGLGVSPNLWTAMFFLAATGAADMTSTVLRQTIRQLNTPDAVRGRMSATSMIFNMAGPRLGDFEAGAVAALIGPRWSVVTGGIGCLVVAVFYAIRAKELRVYQHENAAQ